VSIIFSIFDKEVTANMNSDDSLIARLKPQYFWDVDLSRAKHDSVARLIIERVFTLGEVHEMNLVISFFGKEKVVEVLCSLPCIDPKSLNFLNILTTIPFMLVDVALAWIFYEHYSRGVVY